MGWGIRGTVGDMMEINRRQQKVFNYDDGVDNGRLKYHRRYRIPHKEEIDCSIVGGVQRSGVQDEYGGLARRIDCFGIHRLESDGREASSYSQPGIPSMVFVSSGGTTY